MEDDHNFYYNRENRILEFSVQLIPLSKAFRDVPPTKLFAYAILDNSLDVFVESEEEKYTSTTKSDEMCLDMGSCSIKESVIARIKIINETDVPQHYGFLNLPQVIVFFSKIKVLIAVCDSTLHCGPIMDLES